MTAALQHELLYLDSVPPEPASEAQQDLVLIHGWGCDSRIWQHVAPALSQRFRVHLLDLPGFGRNSSRSLWRDEGQLLAALAEVLPAAAHLVGFSLGGNLALAYAHRFPARVLSLDLIGCNPSFVVREHWLHAMPVADFDAFYELSQNSPALALKRFQQLQAKGEPNGRDLLRQLRSFISDEFNCDGIAIADALLWLRGQDQRQMASALSAEVRWISGEYDELVPATAVADLPGYTPLAGVGHLPMLSCPETLLQLLLQRAPNTPPRSLDKQRIARSFSAAADSYDGAAVLQRSVADSLAALVPFDDGPGIALDLGCGTGHFLQHCKPSAGGLQWLGGDIAEGMLRHCRQHHPQLEGSLMGMDADSLPLADGALQGIFSSLALQWCSDLDVLFAELYRVVAPKGWLAFSTLVEGTLVELKSAWQQVDGYVHVNRFYGNQAWLDAAQGAGWRVDQWQQQASPRYYGQLRELLYELKALGAHNVNSGMPSGLTGKRSWRQLQTAYEQHRLGDGRLPASWQVVYGVLRRG